MSLDDAGEEACFLIRASSFPQAPFISPPPRSGPSPKHPPLKRKKVKKKAKKCVTRSSATWLKERSIQN
jgi:hypothetical protein